ncbi:hypothetical protein [Spirillospora sp. NPDC047279]|uniref:hypothetical protein n=1 Tax=Spirillospora sp. NPDC047279 TaxID=3155478 RepID=UPI0033C0364C
MTDDLHSHQPESADHRQTDLVALLRTTYADLLTAERIITGFSDHAPGGFVSWGLAEGEASEAVRALRYAPSLQPPADPPPSTDPPTTIKTLHELAASAAQALITAAELAIASDDRLACLQAALHAGRLATALR